MSTLQAPVLDAIVRRLVEEFDPEAIYLFGSHAWGEPDADSDLDLLVIVAESKERPARRIWRARRAIGDVRMPIDVFVETRSEFDGVKYLPSALENRIWDGGLLVHGRKSAGQRRGVAP